MFDERLDEALTKQIGATEKLLSELRELQQKNDEVFWRSDIAAANGSGLGRDLFRRVKHLVPHIEIPPAKEGGSTTIVYPKEALREWANRNVKYY